MDEQDTDLTSLDASVSRWLEREVGVDRPRRVVRADDEEILVSKFEAGFAAQLHRLLDEVPELFDGARVIERYQNAAAELPADTPRVDAWHAAMHEALRMAGQRLELDDSRLAEVRVGVDSVRAVLEACKGPAILFRENPRWRRECRPTETSSPPRGGSGPSSVDPITTL